MSKKYFLKKANDLYFKLFQAAHGTEGQPFSSIHVDVWQEFNFFNCVV